MAKNGNGNGNGSTALAASFIVDMPLNGPALGFDPYAESFTWHDVLPSNYWNLDLLEEKATALGGNPIVTPARVRIQPVVDPDVPEAQQDMSPKIVLEFAENVPALVFNKTRCTLATKITGTANPARWAELLPQVELYAGAYRDMAAAMQILFRPVRQAQPAQPAQPARPAANGRSTRNSDNIIDGDKLNDDLFS